MTLDASTVRFFENIHLHSNSPAWIEERLLSELSRLATGGIPWPVTPTGCLLADIGNYLVRVLHVLASVAENLLGGNLISDYLNARIQELVAEDDLSTANYIDDKHAALLEIASKLSQALKDCESAWSFTLSTPAPTIPFQEVHGGGSPLPAHQMTIASSADHLASPSVPMYRTAYSMPAQTLSPDEPGEIETESLGSYSGRGTSKNPALGDDQPYQSSSASIGASDSGPSPSNTADPLSQVPLLGELKTRGKGHYTCPRRHDCRKGGVQPNCELTVFERNSAFRAHLQLHGRAFKCDPPGCTNKKGFARIDQLERHKASVRHHTPGWVENAPP